MHCIKSKVLKKVILHLYIYVINSFNHLLIHSFIYSCVRLLYFQLLLCGRFCAKCRKKDEERNYVFNFLQILLSFGMLILFIAKYSKEIIRDSTKCIYKNVKQHTNYSRNFKMREFENYNKSYSRMGLVDGSPFSFSFFIMHFFQFY